MDVPDQGLAIPSQREHHIAVILRSPPFSHPSLLLEHLDRKSDGPTCQAQRPCALLKITSGVLLDIKQDSGLAWCHAKGE
jgi:hypothetical protein